MNYYQRHLGDYARDTGHLTLLEHGVYGVLLDWQYGTEKPLPPEPEAVLRICRAFSKVEKAAVLRVRSEFFNADGWNNRAGREVAKCKEVNLKKAIGALRMHHSSIAGLSDMQVVEWANAHGYALDEQCKSTTTRARSKTPRLQDAKIEGLVAPAANDLGDGGGWCQVGDQEILGWCLEWPGEMESGTPKFHQEWVKQALVKLNGRTQWPNDWKRWLIACWRTESRTFGAGDGAGMKKNAANSGGIISASVEEIGRQKKKAALSEEEDALAFEINSLRQGNIEVPAEKLARWKQIKNELAAY